MKKMTLLLVALFSFACTNSFAQSRLAVFIGNIPTAAGSTGSSPAPTYTTSDRILKSGKLFVNATDAAVESYSFSLKVGDRTVLGPIDVTGPMFTAAMLNGIRDTRGPNVLVSFENIKIRQAGTLHTMPSIALKYDQ